MSASASRYSFHSATPGDLDMLRGWQRQPHVSRWWDAFDPETPEEFDDLRVARWIVSLGGTPFAYMQDYTVHGWDDHHFAHLPPGARGIDQFIGRPDMIGQGHGPAFIAAQVQTLFDQGAPAVATDPHPDNARAIAAYGKAGFQPSGPPQETRWGRVLPMTAWRPVGASGASVT
ncbi:GNAT family N-acetyltransferase [Tateyamaria sp. syn59]|uniref:GNAT family N-acetyltransferase n=1 Tax=Tateyamaria sp. syn59 TaxID=2576942 RepID=UPI0011BF6D0C|nr:GNAT family N-acetyltransferase [Tateyamaria sp. syn59]